VPKINNTKIVPLGYGNKLIRKVGGGKNYVQNEGVGGEWVTNASADPS
jgi:hypothetical protein